MSVNQAEIFKQLKKITQKPHRDEFIYGFMQAWRFPKSTIAQIRQGTSRNIARPPGHVGIKNKLYFHPAQPGEDLDSLLDCHINDEKMAKNKIRFIMVTDFSRFLAWDTLSRERLDIELDELYRNYGFFLPLVGLEKAIIGSENPADVKAAEKMGKLFDHIRDHNGLSKPEDLHPLNIFLTRLLFCLFAEDTGIFQSSQFSAAVASYTEDDGSDVAAFLRRLFHILNSEEKSSARHNLPTHLAAFPYVNGGLFESDDPIPEFNKKSRKTLLECARLNWSEINPDIFGSMFQAVIDSEQRARLGQHYTSYQNIIKVIQPLFLDPLRAELKNSIGNITKLKKLQLRIGKIKIFDPACGSGNFLIVSYKELRKIEIEVIEALNDAEMWESHQPNLYNSNVHLSSFYGIEIDDFACQIARLSLWLAEHQLNILWKKKFNFVVPALPLKDSGHIYNGNSLQLDWRQLCPISKQDEIYLIGNPPFLGTLGRTAEQRSDMHRVFSGFKALGNLDYVACWFWKGAQYIQQSNAELALVATNSLCQGEQVSTLWPHIFNLGLNIHFAYPTFAWKNNARDKAAVHVIIVGLSGQKKQKRQLFQEIDGELHIRKVKNISPYLVEGSNLVVGSPNKPLTKGVSPLLFGNKPTDGGHLLLNRIEHDELLIKEPKAARWIKKVLGAAEFLNEQERWCLWLVDATDADLQSMPMIQKRVMAVREHRLKSQKLATKKKANIPHLFDENRQPTSGYYILIPSVSSERRTYVPLGFIKSDIISTNRNYIIPNGTLYEFGILSSLIHNDWMRLVTGRLESRYSYSAAAVYNPFPWPQAGEEDRQCIARLAEKVILTREEFFSLPLAALYDPQKMPEKLKAAHQALDQAVDRLYRDRPFKDSADRLSHLLACYASLIKEQS